MTSSCWPGNDGYERMEAAQAEGWMPISAWGCDGWDLGSWPHVVVYHGGETSLAIDVEGDTRIETFETQAARDEGTDRVAFMHWKTLQAPWVQGISSFEQMPSRLRGPFTSGR